MAYSEEADQSAATPTPARSAIAASMPRSPCLSELARSASNPSLIASYCIFRVERARMAKMPPSIQKRITTLVSFQPLSSKW